MNRVVIVGAGAMGCLFAARLVQAGAEVSLVDVDQGRLDALNREGVTLEDDAGVRTVPVTAAVASALRSPPDLLLLLTKSLHTEAAVRSIAHLAGEDTWALTLQNGLGNAEVLTTAFAPQRVLVGVTDYPSNLDGMTRVSSHGRGHVRLGPISGRETSGADRAADLLNRAGFHASVDPAIEVAVWEKVAFNAALNPLGAVTGLTNGGLDTPYGRRVIGAILAETVAAAATKGVLLDLSAIELRVANALATHRDHRASMLQDMTAGRRTEIDAINGAIVSVAKAGGSPAPVTAAIADLVRLMERR